MFTPLKTLLVAGGLALGLAASVTTPAQAAGSGSLTITFGDAPQQVHHRGFRRNFHRDGRRARFCNPRRALRKAERRGLRRAHIRRINRHRIVVAGRMRGERVVIGMGRHRSCPVDFVRVRDGRRGRINRIEAPIVRDAPRQRIRNEQAVVQRQQGRVRQNRRRDNR